MGTDEHDIARWRRDYVDGLIREDSLNIESVSQFNTMRTLLQLLQRSVGSPASYASLARDLKVSSVTVKKYIDVLEALFIVFTVRPYSTNIARRILKEPKIYFYDTGLVIGNEGIKFENFVAVSLLKHVWALTDQTGEETTLGYLGTKEGQEVDFCIAKEGKLTQLLEVKLHETTWSKSLLYFCQKYTIEGIQLVSEMRQRAERQQGSLTLQSASAYLQALFL